MLYVIQVEESPRANVGGRSQQLQKQTQRRSAEQQAGLEAVATAKVNLLRSSLDMLVAGGRTTPERAADLIKRHNDGDMICDTAIEQYAGDRDAESFLETLVILANNSKEALESLIRATDGVNVRQKGYENGDEQETDDYTDDFENPEDDEEDESYQPEEGTEESSEDDSDYDSEDFTQSNLDKPQQDLLGVVANLANHNIIDDNVKLALVRLISERDERMFAAYDMYQRRKDANDLIDTMVRLGRLAHKSNTGEKEAVEIEMVPVHKSVTPKPPSGSSTQKPEKPSPAAEPSNLLILNTNDMKRFLDMLVQEDVGVLSTTRYALLLRQLDQNDARLIQIFRNYEQHKDVQILVEDLRGLEVDVNDTDDNPESAEDSEDEDGEDKDDGEDELDEHDQRFNNVVNSMKLNELETGALRLAILRDDPEVKDALQAFRDDVIAKRPDSENVLTRKLKMITKNVIANTLDAAGYATNVKESDEESSDYDEDDDNGGYDGEPDGTNPDQSEDQTRSAVFTILISELVKASIISSEDGNSLLQLFKSNNEVTSLPHYIHTKPLYSVLLLEMTCSLIHRLNHANTDCMFIHLC